jgi:hypothetical protein
LSPGHSTSSLLARPSLGHSLLPRTRQVRLAGLARNPCGPAALPIISRVSRDVRSHQWPVVVDICSRSDVPAEIEARACEAVQRDGPGWMRSRCSVSPSTLRESRTPGSLGSVPSRCHQEIKCSSRASRRDSRAPAMSPFRTPAPHGPPINLYDRVVRASLATTSPTLLQRTLRRARARPGLLSR